MPTDSDAMRRYQQAISSARANGFVHGSGEIARVYLPDGRYTYSSVGSPWKVKQLDELFPYLRPEGSAPRAADTIGAPVEHLDIAMVLKVSQALSDEIVLEKLIDTLLRTALEQAGAERGLLILPQGAELRIKAEATTDGRSVTLDLRDAPISGAELPESIVRYATRTQEGVILDDASSQDSFSDDEYIRRKHARSVLCLPLMKQGKPVALLYLENNLAPRVFTSARIAVLRLLASQAATSLENSLLYRELQERETKIRHLVDANVIGIFIFGQSAILEANDAFLEMIGYDREDLLSGRGRLTDLTPPEWRDRTARAWAEMESTGTVRPFEKEYFRKDGSRVPVLIGSAAFDERRDKGVAFVLDLTKRKRAEQALMRSEAYLAETQRLTHTGSWAWAPRSQKVLYCSEEMFRLFGLDPKDGLPVRERFRERIHPADRERIREKFEKSLREGVDSFDEYRVVLPDGTVRYVYASGHPVLDANGEVIEFVGTATDVTHRKHAEHALRASEAKFRDFAETASDWLWEIGPDYKFTLLTENAFGSDPSHRIGTTCWDHALDLETEPEKWRLIRETLDSRKPFRDFEYCAAGGNGSPMYVKVSGKPVFDADGQFHGYRGSGTDMTERKRADQALMRSAAYLAETQRLTHTGTWAWDARSQKVLYCSDEMFRIYGLDPQEHLPTRKNFRERVHPEDRNRVDESFARVVNEKVDSFDEYRVVMPDGTVRHVNSSGHPVLDGNGELIEFVGTAIDVTERKHADDMERFGILVQGVTDYAIYMLDPEGRIKNWNAGGQRIKGYLPAEVLNRHFSIFYTDEDRATELPQRALAIAERDGRYEAEGLRVRKDGTTFWAGIVIDAIRDNDGKLFGFAKVTRDLTERRAAEEQLRQAQKMEAIATERKRADEMLREVERRFRTYVDHATEALFVHDGSQLGKIIDVNRQACESLGYTREELIGMTPLDFDPNMDEASLQRVIDRIDAGEIVTFETSHRSKGGAVFPVEVRARRFRYEGHLLILSLARNITDQKRAEESLRKMQMELAHANRIAMMGQLTASIAHEVNQPIATARNNASAALKFLDRKPPDLAEVREALDCVVNDSERAGAVIDRIRAHIKKAPPRKESFDLNDAITEVIDLMAVDVANNRVRVQAHLAEGLPAVEGDRVQLQQVVLNLMLNAVEAMSAVIGPRELLISTTQTEAAGALVAVRDSGPGIDPEAIERVFESFYTTKSSGLGLGLSICRSIVEAHGGRLWAEVNKPRGAAFQFTLPAPDGS